MERRRSYKPTGAVGGRGNRAESPGAVVRACVSLSAGLLGVSFFAAPALAQQINHDDAGPLVIGRDPRELGEIIGKQFLLKVWLTDVGGPGFQSIRAVRLGTNGNIALPGLPPIHAEGLSIGALEAQIVALYKPRVPTVKVWVSILDKNPPAPPPPPPAPPPPAPAKTQATTAPSTKPAPATKPAKEKAKAKANSTTAPATRPASPATTQTSTAPSNSS